MAEEIKKEERLLKVLSLVNEWLKFAEAKNAMLIAFNGASIYGIAKALELDVIKNTKFFFIYACIIIVILIFSTVICLLSFVPKVKIISSGYYSESTTPNSLFFEHLKTRTEKQIIQDICETQSDDFNGFEKDIASQIKQNSEIASKKLSYFTVAIWFTVSAYVTLIVALLFWFINKSWANGK
jgi:hypothetical protein